MSREQGERQAAPINLRGLDMHANQGNYADHANRGRRGKAQIKTGQHHLAFHRSSSKILNIWQPPMAGRDSGPREVPVHSGWETGQESWKTNQKCLSRATID